MTIKDFFQDTGPIGLGLWLGRHCSLSSGRRLAAVVARVISAFQSTKMMKAIKVNQWVASDGKLTRAALKARSRAVTRNIVTALFEYFYYYQHVEEAKQRIILSPELKAMLEDSQHGRLQILLGPHLGNFDLFGMMLVKFGLKTVVLSYPKPNKTYLAQNQLREKVGMRIMPISLSAFREAKKLMMQEGYSLATGVDRPIEGKDDQKYKPAFFGRPANLSTYYVRLARETGAAVRVACGVTREDGTFYYDCTPPIVFENYDNLTDDIVLNAEKVMREAEKFILPYLEQWAMFYPIWPEALTEIQNLL
jgi:KDO2-lipid IV(A) lauroyltransferase